MVNWWQFAIFVVVDIDQETINKLLASYRGKEESALWLATKRYEDAHEKLPRDSREVNFGTKPPIPKDFKSPWIGSRLEELVQWLKVKPEHIDLKAYHFAVLDKGAKDDPLTMVVCRIGGIGHNDDNLYLFRKEAEEAVAHLIGASSDGWIEFTRGGEKNAQIIYDDD